jgi:serine/threonine protein kinase
VKYATHKKTGEECAIKCIDRVNTNPDELVHEAMLVQLVEEHPGIIKIKDVYEDRTHYYLVMELYPPFFFFLISSFFLSFFPFLPLFFPLFLLLPSIALARCHCAHV